MENLYYILTEGSRGLKRSQRRLSHTLKKRGKALDREYNQAMDKGEWFNTNRNKNPHMKAIDNELERVGLAHRRGYAREKRKEKRKGLQEGSMGKKRLARVLKAHMKRSNKSVQDYRDSEPKIKKASKRRNAAAHIRIKRVNPL